MRKTGLYIARGDDSWDNGLKCLSDDEEDETTELLRELEKIKRERAEQREQEVGMPSRELGLGFSLLI